MNTHRTAHYIGAETPDYTQIAHLLAELGYTVTSSLHPPDPPTTPPATLTILGRDLDPTLAQTYCQHMTRQPTIVLALAGSDDMPRIEALLAAGAHDYCLLPSSPAMLRVRLTHVLPPENAPGRRSVVVSHRDMHIGRQIQASFLPQTLPTIEGWESAASFQPAREVGGDFYDLFTMTQNRRVAIMIADVCDKGVNAALFMALFRSLLRAFASQRHSMSWADMLDDSYVPATRAGKSRRQTAVTIIGANALVNAVLLTNAYILENHHHARMYASLFFGILDPGSGSLVYVNGGHPPPLLLGHDGSTRAVLEPTGPVVGIFPDADFGIEQLHIEPHETLFCYTDGVVDARNSDGTFFGEARLNGLLAQPIPTVDTLVQTVEQAVYQHIHNAQPFDDITMLALRRTHAEEPPPLRKRGSMRDVLGRITD